MSAENGSILTGDPEEIEIGEVIDYNRRLLGEIAQMQRGIERARLMAWVLYEKTGGEDLSDIHNALAMLKRDDFSAPLDRGLTRELESFKVFRDSIGAWLCTTNEDVCPVCGRDPNSHEAECWIEQTLRAWDRLHDPGYVTYDAILSTPPVVQPEELT